MSLGLNDRFNILNSSPLDSCCSSASQPAGETAEEVGLVASRYNVHATTEDGDLVIWNTLSGSMSTFPSNQRDKIKSLLTRKVIKARADGVEGYLQKRGFLVKEGTDERRRFRHRFGKQHYRSDILELMLLASEDCNFRCEYCYEEFARGTMEPWVRSAIKKLVESRLDGLRCLNVGWFGGEPLYGLGAIEDLAPFFKKVTDERGIALLSGITTNGYLLTKEVAEKLLSWGVGQIQVTIDGAAEDQDRLRHTRTGEGTFARVYDNLLGLREFDGNFNVDIRINFDPTSEPRLEGFVSQIGREFGSDHRFNVMLRPVGRWGGANDEDLDVCGLRESDEIAERLTALASDAGLGNYDDLRRSGGFGALACYASRPYHFIIGADGKLMKCSVALDTNDANVVGKITPNGSLEVDEDKFTFWTEPVFSTVEKCDKCVVLPVCQTVACPLVRLKNPEDTGCPPLRSKAKKRLLWTQRSAKLNSRSVTVKSSVSAPTSKRDQQV
jgi:uncharacterized protein